MNLLEKTKILADVGKYDSCGPKTATKIIECRTKITKYEQLHKLGAWIKRAKPFIEVDGKRQKMLMESC